MQEPSSNRRKSSKSRASPPVTWSNSQNMAHLQGWGLPHSLQKLCEVLAHQTGPQWHGSKSAGVTRRFMGHVLAYLRIAELEEPSAGTSHGNRLNQAAKLQHGHMTWVTPRLIGIPLAAMKAWPHKYGMGAMAHFWSILQHNYNTLYKILQLLDFFLLKRTRHGTAT